MTISKIKITKKNELHCGEVIQESESERSVVGMKPSNEVLVSDIEEVEGHVVSFHKGGKITCSEVIEDE